MIARTPPRRRATWRTLIVYLFVTPAALQLLARLDEYYEFSGLIGRLLRAWSNFIHGIWAYWLAFLPDWIELSANQIDVLTWTVAMIAAATFGPSEEGPEQEASQKQAATLFWIAFAIASAIFLAPYYPALVRIVERQFALSGVAGAFGLAGFVLFALMASGGVLVSTVLSYRAKHADQELVPLWLHLEQVLGVLLIGFITGWLLGSSEFESAASVDRLDLPLIRSLEPALLWDRLIEPMIFAAVFCFTLGFVRRENWPSMPRMVAAAFGIALADRLIVMLDPIGRSVTSI